MPSTGILGRTLEKTKHSILLSPISVGRHVLRNRVIMGSMHTRLEYENDGVRKQALFYAERAMGGAALIVTGGVAPNWEGRIEQEALVLTEMEQVEEHRVIVSAVHAAGAKILLQVLHTGAYAKHDDVVGFSAKRSPINHRTPRALSSDEIEQTIEDFVHCSELAVAAGYDGVEFMGSEGYFLNQAVTRRMNDRADDWGGSAEKRMRCPLEIVRRTRARLGGDPMIAYRISATDLVEEGQTSAEIDAFARALEAAGVDLLSTGIGWHESQAPTIAYVAPRGAFAFASQRLKAVVSIPVVASNRINMPETAERILAEGAADLISMARPLLADADLVRKYAEGRADEINTCIACNQACLDRIFTDQTASCLVNPRACRETEFDGSRAAVHRRVAVVGGGAAGLSFAVTAAERGHDVVLYEADKDIGGQINLARAVPLKGEFDELLRYFRRRLELLEVDVRLNVATSAEQLVRERYDAVVLATGIRPRRLDVTGSEHRSVVAYTEILSGRVKAGSRVIVVGMGGVGFDVADKLTAGEREVGDIPQFLKHWGIDPEVRDQGGLATPTKTPPPRKVVMLQRGSGRPGERLGKSTGWIHRLELKSRGVEMYAGCVYRKIDDAGFHVDVQGEPRLFEADTIVYCAGQEPHTPMLHELRAANVPTHIIGGARDARQLDAVRAIEEGFRLAYAL
ncbi:MAG: NADPH-dependent 2,4-dienoyl-CoA reductase [Hyphomonadaceae bacterium]|nr:NADPH-dependent 2,4-dienoyl-CoA reductase [Hyphomonadaceae bacterium]